MGIEISMEEVKAMRTTKSQCEDCKNSFGFDGCKVFGTAPDEYALVSAKVVCPKRKLK